MDAGRRTASLRLLARVADVLACSPGDLLEVMAEEPPVFGNPGLARRLAERDLRTPDGAERGWVHAAQLAWQRHYGRARRA